MSESFMDSMIRRYTPYYKWNAFDQDDIADIKNLIDYARGLVIKNEPVAIQYETDASMASADRYMQAVNNTLGVKYSEYERKLFIENYKESNKYYQYLMDEYRISPYDARTAKDYHIMKALNNTLDKYHKNLFEKAYYNALNYFEKVTSTTAFNNQQLHREFFEELIIYMTTQRYIDYEMDGYFNVDTYTKRQLKNGFISYGLDYFDSFSIEYQRRTYKLINDMIRNKGSNEVFDIIRDIFSFNNIEVNRYSLGKTTSGEYNDPDLIFYKTNIDKTLDIQNDPQVSYDKVTQNDPYWRAHKDEVLNKHFNVINTKYISVDTIIDLISNSKQMSYFWGLLNTVTIQNRKTIEAYALSHNIDYDKAEELASIEGTDFSFLDRNISTQPINIFDGIVALFVLVLERMKWSDNIHHKKGSLQNVYTYNFANNPTDEIKQLRNYLNWDAKKQLNPDERNTLKNFIDKFHLQDFSSDNNSITFAHIQSIYDGRIDYANQLNALSLQIQAINGSHILADHVRNHELYAALDYVLNLLFHPNRKIKFSLISRFDKVKELLVLFLYYQIDTGYKPNDYGFQTVLDNKDLSYILTDLDDFVKNINDTNLNQLYDRFLKDKSTINLKIVCQNIDSAVATALTKNDYSGTKLLLAHPDLSAYLDIVGNLTKYLKTKFTMEDFANIFRNNENVRTDTINLINDTESYTVYNETKKILDKKFTGNFDMYNFMPYKTFSEYLKAKDPDLYLYTRVGSTLENVETYDRCKVLRDKIFALATAIDNHLELDEFSFFLENNFLGIEDYVRQYIYILIQVFKAYTVDTIWSQGVYQLDDPYENTVRVFDDMKVKNAKLKFRDDISLYDSVKLTTHYSFKEDKIEIGERERHEDPENISHSR